MLRSIHGDVIDPYASSFVPPSGAPRLTQASQTPRPRRSAGRAALVAVIAGATVITVVAAGLYLNRRAVARQALIGWLEQRGVDAEVEISRIDLDGVVARLRIGDADDPDLIVERVEVDYALSGPWAVGGMAATPSRIRLVRPVLKARWADGRLSLGALDPLVEEFTRRPPRPDAPAPVMVVETGRLRLMTEYGPYPVLADARMEDGRLTQLSARAPAAALKSGDASARGLGWSLQLTTRGDRMAVSLEARAARADAGGLGGRDLVLSLNGTTPYPDTTLRDAGGALELALAAQAGALALGGAEAEGVRADLRFDGQVRGWLPAFDLRGRGAGRIDAAALAAPGLQARRAGLGLARADLTLDRSESRGTGWRLQGPADLRLGQAWTGGARTGGAAFEELRLTSAALTAGGRGAAFEARGAADLAARRAAVGELSLTGVSGGADLDLMRDGVLRTEARGRMRAAGGAWPLFGAPRADDLPELAEMKRALGDFSTDLGGFLFRSGPGGTEFSLTAPARLAPANGGVLTVRAADAPAYRAAPGARGGGALRLAATPGRGLPELDVAVPDWRLTPEGFQARLDGAAGLDFGPARGIDLATRGLLTSGAGALTFAPDGCVDIGVARLDLGENALTDLAADLCPAGQADPSPLVTVRNGRWSARGALRDLSGRAPFLDMAAADGEGAVSAEGGPQGLSLDLRIARARVRDTAESDRFHPLAAAGGLTLAGDRWTGGFDLATGAAGGQPVARLDLTHDGRAQAGGLTIETPELVFREGGLQPSDLSPLVEGWINAPAEGSAAFSGRFDWTADGGASGGRLTVPRLDFASPAGRVTGLAGQVDFTSLAPLQTAPGQRLTVERLDTLAELTELELTFALDAAAIAVDSADIAVGGGVIRIEPFTVPLDLAQGFGGAIVLERVQLGDILASSGFGDKVALDAVVSGRLPFTSDPRNGVRVTGGTLHAVQPGRLSIAREALTDLQAGGGGEVPAGTVQDLAYQAMENLAFDILSADVNSRDGGRLAVLFRIRGRHDPPERQELRLTLSELISRRFLERSLPLPSGTQIDLTLDTSLNAAQLVSDLMAAARARAGSPPTSTLQDDGP